MIIFQRSQQTYRPQGPQHCRVWGWSWPTRCSVNHNMMFHTVYSNAFVKHLGKKWRLFVSGLSIYASLCLKGLRLRTANWSISVGLCSASYKSLRMQPTLPFESSRWHPWSPVPWYYSLYLGHWKTTKITGTNLNCVPLLTTWFLAGGHLLFTGFQVSMSEFTLPTSGNHLSSYMYVLPHCEDT